MRLEGKISVKHFLKKSLKPLVEGKAKKYPLYVRIRLDNKKTEFKSEYWEYLNLNNSDRSIETLARSSYTNNITGSNKVEASEDLFYVSENEFSQKEFLIKISEEAKVICEIIDFYRRQGVNIIEHDPKLTIEIAQQHIKDIVFHQMKGTLMEKLVDGDYSSIYRIIDWSLPFYDIIKALREVSFSDSNPTKFYRDMLLEIDFTSIDCLLNFTPTSGTSRIYQWENKSLRNSLESHLLQSVSKASTEKLLSQIDLIYRQRVKYMFIK